MGKSHLFSRTVWKSKLRSEVLNAKYSKAAEEINFFHRLIGVLLFIALDYSASALQRNVTIWARVQSLLGLKVVALVPSVMPLVTAHRTALL